MHTVRGIPQHLHHGVARVLTAYILLAYRSRESNGSNIHIPPTRTANSRCQSPLMDSVSLYQGRGWLLKDGEICGTLLGVMDSVNWQAQACWGAPEPAWREFYAGRWTDARCLVYAHMGSLEVGRPLQKPPDTEIFTIMRSFFPFNKNQGHILQS